MEYNGKPIPMNMRQNEILKNWKRFYKVMKLMTSYVLEVYCLDKIKNEYYMELADASFIWSQS